MNDLVSFFEIAVLSHCFITVWAMNDYFKRLVTEHDKMLDKINELQTELDHLYRMLTRLQEDQDNEQ